MSSGSDYQSLTRLIEQQVSTLKSPFRYDGKLERVAEKYNYSSRRLGGAIRKGLCVRMDSLIYKRLTYTEVNSSLASQCEVNFSKQAIAKVSDQIAELWSDQAEQHREALYEIEKADVPVHLQSEYKLYMLNDLIESVKFLPEVDGGNHEKYNLKRQELLNRVNRLEKLKRKKELTQKFKQFVQLKIGGRIDVQKVIKPHNRELRDEIAKLRIMLEKLNTLDGEGRKELIKLLNDSVLNQKC
jgi:hypothetical protein